MPHLPHTWYLSAQSFIRLLKLVWREYDIVAMNEWKKKCVDLQRTWVSKRTVLLTSFALKRYRLCGTLPQRSYSSDPLQLHQKEVLGLILYAVLRWSISLGEQLHVYYISTCRPWVLQLARLQKVLSKIGGRLSRSNCMQEGYWRLNKRRLVVRLWCCRSSVAERSATVPRSWRWC